MNRQNKKDKKEKRRYPRIEHKLPLKIAVNGYDFSTATHNLSCLGAYCRINKYVPPFTKVAVRLYLPVVSNSKEKSWNVECKGVIVRTDDEASQKGFNVAIFFNEINASQRQKIAQYVNQFLP